MNAEIFSRWLEKSQKTLLLGLTLLLGIALSPVRHGNRIFLELGNLTDVLRQVSETGILAVGMTVVILTGGIDLSVGAMVALSATLVAKALMQWHWALGPSLALVLGVGLVTGLFFSQLVSRLNIPPFVATLSAMGALRGIARLIANGGSIAITPAQFDPSSGVLDLAASGAPASFFKLAGKWGGLISVPALIYVAIAVGVALWLRYSVRGRHVFAVGGSPRAAKYAGISIPVTLTLAYILCSLCASVAGVLHAAQLEQGNANDGMGYELDAIAAVVIGGTRLTGGLGSIAGTVVGTLVIGILNNILGLNNVDANIQLIVKGALILLAMGIQQFRVQKERI